MYVNSAVYANGKKFKNVVANGVATNITLKDTTAYGNFCNSFREFYARKISYTRHFGQETLIGGESSGWEAISLPFTPAEVRHETNGLLGSFADANLGNKKPFWLCVLEGDEFIPAKEILIGRPYIIAMPNNSEYSGVLYVNSDKCRTLRMHTLTGLLVKTLDVKAGTNEYGGIAKGVYVIDGEKVIVK